MRRARCTLQVFSLVPSLLQGRIINKRSAGSKLYFYDIRSGETMLQVMSSLNTYETNGQTPEEVAIPSSP